MEMNHKGTVYHHIGQSRMSAVRDFSRWKEGAPGDLKDFRAGLHHFFGMPIAKGGQAKGAIEAMADPIISMIMDSGPSAIPSVAIVTPDGVWHIPPKPSSLVLMALRKPGPSARMTDSLIAFGSIGTDKEDPDSSIVMQRLPAIFGDIAMGEARNTTVCVCVDNDKEMWKSNLTFGERGRRMNLFVLDDAPYSSAEAELVTEAKIAFERPMLYDDFNSIGDVEALVSGIMSLIRGLEPSGKYGSLIRSAARYGKYYIAKGASSYNMPEEIVPLGIRVEGLFVEGT